MISGVKFTHPKQAIEVIKLIRQQMLFNEIFKSCVRSYDDENEKLWEKNAVIVEFCAPKLGRLDCLVEIPETDGQLIIMGRLCVFI